MPDAYISRSISRFTVGHDQSLVDDDILVEEPLEIRVDSEPLTITMRTPGDDFALAAGFLLSEGVIQDADDIASIRHCASSSNIVRVELAPGVSYESKHIERKFLSTSSCGLCGKASLEALAVRAVAFEYTDKALETENICQLPTKLREAQRLFSVTGGSHAAGLFDDLGNLLAVHEDIGRHNAVDKIIGQRVLSREKTTPDHILCISGRASFEILQKAIAAGISTIVAVGAPSSLAVETAERFNVRLIGFTGVKGFNLYT